MYCTVIFVVIIEKVLVAYAKEDLQWRTFNGGPSILGCGYNIYLVHICRSNLWAFLSTCYHYHHLPLEQGNKGVVGQFWHFSKDFVPRCKSKPNTVYNSVPCTLNDLKSFLIYLQFYSASCFNSLCILVLCCLYISNVQILCLKYDSWKIKIWIISLIREQTRLFCIFIPSF